MATEMTGAKILVQSLEDLGVKQVFGYTGATILPVFHAMEEAGINITVNSNEQSCAFSAAGYSRASGKVGVADRCPHGRRRPGGCQLGAPRKHGQPVMTGARLGGG